MVISQMADRTTKIWMLEGSLSPIRLRRLQTHLLKLLLGQKLRISLRNWYNSFVNRRKRVKSRAKWMMHQPISHLYSKILLTKLKKSHKIKTSLPKQGSYQALPALSRQPRRSFSNTKVSMRPNHCPSRSKCLSKSKEISSRIL